MATYFTDPYRRLPGHVVPIDAFSRVAAGGTVAEGVTFTCMRIATEVHDAATPWTSR